VKIVLATGNPGKVAEFEDLVSHLDINCVTQAELGVTSVDETGLTFVENALLKARHAVNETGLPAIADDSGLVVAGLDDEPGIFSARYAGDGCSLEDCIDKVLLNLKGKTGDQRRAYFYSSVVFMTSAKEAAPCIANGIWHGEILQSRQGNRGMGYDPIFYIPDHGCSAAELEVSFKNRISHRGQAMQQLCQLMGWQPVARTMP